MGRGEGFGVGEISDGFGGIFDAQRRRYIPSAVKGGFLFRARVFFRLRHAGSIDQISRSDQAQSGGRRSDVRGRGYLSLLTSAATNACVSALKIRANSWNSCKRKFETHHPPSLKLWRGRRRLLGGSRRISDWRFQISNRKPRSPALFPPFPSVKKNSRKRNLETSPKFGLDGVSPHRAEGETVEGPKLLYRCVSWA
jgi:hypothetical protein